MKKKAVTTLATVAAAGLGGSAIAGAAQDTNSSSGSTASSGTSGRTAPARPNETALTGETAAKVKAAALAKVEGTVLRVETDRGGVYEAHVRKTDGTEVEVRVNKDFEVTATEEYQAGPQGQAPRRP